MTRSKLIQMEPQYYVNNREESSPNNSIRDELMVSHTREPTLNSTEINSSGPDPHEQNGK